MLYIVNRLFTNGYCQQWLILIHLLALTSTSKTRIQTRAGMGNSGDPAVLHTQIQHIAQLQAKTILSCSLAAKVMRTITFDPHFG